MLLTCSVIIGRSYMEIRQGRALTGRASPVSMRCAFPASTPIFPSLEKQPAYVISSPNVPHTSSLFSVSSSTPHGLIRGFVGQVGYWYANMFALHTY
ncbi:hypothetical protein OUZ56_011327 [Daphnia magna]|uniref:Uncharacterized protein n=1 Tax=Daphnia magna TaxID=35525 RepID=A0ABQ9YZV2_9CRUS|nr:hypothetical protein OUZ56_011327 [Daphnia magna]